MAILEGQRDELMGITGASAETLVERVRELAAHTTNKKTEQLEHNLVMVQKREEKEMTKMAAFVPSLVEARKKLVEKEKGHLLQCQGDKIISPEGE